MTERRRFILFGFAESLTQIIPVILMPFYLDLFQVDGYGNMNLMVAYFALFIPLISLCFNQVTIKALHADQTLEVPIAASFFVILSVGSFFALSVLCLRSQLSNFFDVEMLIASIIIGVMSSMYLIFKDIAIHSGNQSTYSVMILCQVLATHFLVLIFFYLSPLQTPWEYRFYGEMISYGIFGSLFTFFWIRKLDLSIYKVSIFEVKGFIIENITIAISTVPRMLLRWYRVVLDRQYLAFCVAISALGQYTVATQIATMLTFPLVIVAAYFSPMAVIALKKNDIKIPVIFFVSGILLLFSTLLMWKLTSITIIEIYIGAEFNGLSLTISSLYISLFLTLFSASMLSVFIQSGTSEKRYDFVLLVFALSPLAIFLLRPSEVEDLAVLNLLVSLVYFVFTCIEFTKVYRQIMSKRSVS